MKRILIAALVAILSGTAIAQEVNFYSAAFDYAVKNQLGIDKNAVVTQNMIDTVTILDLSGYGLDDIRDMVYFSSVINLNLSYNKIENISSLVNLQHLAYLDLKYNRLKNLNDLAFSKSFEMTVLITGNYINEYLLILNNPNCLFTIIGLNWQNLPYRVNRFYTDFDLSTSQKLINYNVWTFNEYDSLYLMVDGKKELITNINEDIQQKQNTTDNVVYLNFDNQNVDSVYFIMPQTIEMMDHYAIITPDIPVDCRIISAEALKSSISYSDNSIIYMATESVNEDTIRIGFGKNDNDIKGYTYYYIKNNITQIENVPELNHLLYYPNPAENVLTLIIPNQDNQKATISLISITGQIVYQAVTNEAVYHVNVQSLEKGVYILYVQTKNGNFMEKIIKK